jgi:hypothetical protein
MEGELREAVKVQGGYDSLVVMSMLQEEFAQRRGRAMELPG